MRSGLGKCLGPDKLVLHKRLQMLLYYKLSCHSGTDKVQRWDSGLSAATHRHSLTQQIKGLAPGLLCVILEVCCSRGYQIHTCRVSSSCVWWLTIKAYRQLFFSEIQMLNKCLRLKILLNGFYFNSVLKYACPSTNL